MTSSGGDRRRFNGRTPIGLPINVRFWAKVSGDSFEDCWIWTASLVPVTGYGAFYVGKRKRVNAHRWSYEQMIGPIPDGLHLDHLCRVRHCVNPWHLEPVTPLVNTNRGVGNGKETHCPHGHPYDEANTYRPPGAPNPNGRRQCLTCRGAYLSIYRAMTPEERAERKRAGLPVVDLAAYFANESQENAA